ncbi:hypothetical protein WJ437_07290 [Ignavigranum ruoffiae]|uniref:hypothetical protein n=1 Tax=Ignavigranum ruoffiae TaxID=89093 RepID=UPI003B005FD4
MTVENQVYFDAYDSLAEVKVLEDVMRQNGLPVNALHLYADDEFIKDKEWTTRLAGISEASNLIGYKLADQAKNIIVGIDECHQDKFPNLKFAMEQALNQSGSSSDLDEGHELESFEQDLRDQEPDVPPEEFGVNQDNY